VLQANQTEKVWQKKKEENKKLVTTVCHLQIAATQKSNQKSRQYSKAKKYPFSKLFYREV